MVKNIPTIERSTKIRFGKHVSDSQAENTIVFNASDSAVNATNAGSIYMTPLRVAELAGSNLIGYSASTKEVVDSSVPTSLLGGVTLQSATDRGNVTSNTVQFSNAITSFVTTSNIGVANSAPIHALSVKDKVFMCGPTGDTNTLRVEGTTRSNKFTTGSSINIDESVTNKIQVSGTIHSSTYTGSNLGLANTAPAHALSIGNQGQVQMNVPTESIYALDTVGNVNAQNYRGDSYYLSNLTAENIVNQGNVTSNTVQFTNALTSIYTTSNVDVGGNVFIRESADALYGKIAGANTIAGSTITASTQFSGPGSGLTSIPTNQFATGAIPFSSGGTGQSSYASGTILYGKTSGDSLGQLNPAGSNADAGKFLRLDNNDIPEWAEVPLTLDAVLGNTTAESDGSMSLTDTGTTITTAGKIKAATFEGSGSDIHDINAANVVLGSSTLSTTVLPTVPENKGGTGQTTYTKGQVLYSDASNSLAKLDIGSANQILQVNSDVPEWTSTITGATLSGPSLTGTITASSLTANRIPFTNSSQQLVTDSKLTFDGADTMTIGSNLTISGNLLVQGNTTYQHTKNHTIADPLIELGNANASDTIDLGVIMTRPTANVVSGFMGDEKKYVIAYTLSDPLDAHIVPTNATSDEYITLSVEGGNVSAGNVTTTGTVEAATLKGDGSSITHLDLGDATNTGQVVIARGGTGVTTGLTALNAGNINTGTLVVARGGTGLTTVAENDLLLGPASGTALSKLSAYTQAGGPTSSSPAAMSANSSGGNTASSGNSSADTWKAFDGSDSTSYQSSQWAYGADGTYSGIASNSLGGINGEWIKIQLASSIAPISVFIKGPAPAGNDNLPASWRILGSNNGTNWTQLHSSTTNVTSSGITESFTNTTAYSYLAMVVTNVIPGSGFHFRLSRLSFNYLSGPTEKFLKSSAAGVSWDSVSSTLQAITDGGATTTQTVAFNNTTTGLTSAGDISIASTKKLKFVDDILLEGGSGTSNLKVNNAIILSPEVQGGSTSTKNVLSIDTQTGEIYDSGGQGGSTMEFTHEEGSGDHANVSIGKAAWAGPTGESNLTINTYGSNVLTVTGNVSATNITIGGLHVAASPFNLDDVASAGASANVTSNVIQFTGPHASYGDNNFTTSKSISIGSNVNVTGNVFCDSNLTSQNLQLTNTQIATTWTSGSGTLAIDAKNKSYGTAPLTSIDADVAILSITNLPSGGQIVVPLLASGAGRKVLKTITTGIDFIAFTSDVSIDQNGHGLLTVSKIGASGAEKIYMNAIAFTAA